MYQRVVIAGRLGRDPEMRYTPQGKAVTNFSVAVDEGKETLWFDVVAWERLAETCNEYLSKGAPVLIEGKFRKSTWEDNEGQK